MDLDRDTSNTDECLETALQIFDYCGADSSGTLHVDALMDKCAPSMKTNNTEFNYLKSLLDPNHSNPEINVSKLATALNMFSDGQKSKTDLDESYNLRSGPGPQDSDSGISNDGFLLLEELQSEIREKTHLAAQLRSQLDYSVHQHEETLAAITAERDTLRAHLTMLRDENKTLIDARRDYEDATERLSGSEQALGTARRERDAAARRAAALEDQVVNLEAEKLTLQELLSSSKAECHRINEMYAARQSALLEQSEALRASRAELAARLRDHEQLLQQVLRDKVILEMELKDVLNRSNSAALHLDRSVDVSYTEDQMLTALDSMHADSKFSSDNQVLDDDAFTKALKEQDFGRASNLSLFDEIRLSFCNMSRRDIPESFGNMSRSQILEFNDTQCDKCDSQRDLSTTTVETQTDNTTDNNNVECVDCSKICIECVKQHQNLAKMQSELELSNEKISILQTEFNQYEDNLNIMQKCAGQMNKDKATNGTQTDEQPIEPCTDCIEKDLECVQLKDNNIKLNLDLEEFKQKVTSIKSEYQINSNTLQDYINGMAVETSVVETQTDLPIEAVLEDSTKQCLECEQLKDYTAKLEHDVVHANNNLSEMHLDLNKYENTLNVLQKHVEEGMERNNFLEAMSGSLQARVHALESACSAYKEKIDSLSGEVSCVLCQTDESDVASIGTQVEVACMECEKRNAVVPHRSLRRLLCL
ncbi:uncharacterized protein isoform X2 [Choristoneura fumiferana]|uniref:uncharacterized protein isoform X2 n=1 Tax=Choristoneura fumiferana TaxID=7141 RepID=UPI003D158075